MKLKYIIVRDDHFTHGRDNGPERAIIFDNELIHKNVARVHRVGGLVVVSAGFVKINGLNVETYGESESLEMVSRPQDQAIVMQALVGEDYRLFDELHKHIDSLESLIDGDEDDSLGVFLVPIKNCLKSLLPPFGLPKQD